jgi:hypothetical protein
MPSFTGNIKHTSTIKNRSNDFKQQRVLYAIIQMRRIYVGRENKTRTMNKSDSYPHPSP